MTPSRLMLSGPQKLTDMAPDPGASPDAAQLVARNVLYMLIGQVASAAIAFVVTASIARHLGPSEYGVLFLSTSFVSLAFILVDLGQGFYAVSAIARDPSRTGVILGTGMALRLTVAALLVVPVWGLAALLCYSEQTRAAILATFVFLLITSIGAGFSIVFRGLERMDGDAVSQTATKALYGLTSLAAVVLGARVVGIIHAQAVGTALGLVVCVALLRRLRIPRPRVQREVAIELLKEGAPFLIWSAIVAVHSTMDSILLSKLATDKVVGWYGASSRLTQILILPASIIGSALFPTLSRLFVQSPAAFSQMTRSALKWMLYVGSLSAAGTYLFAQQAVALVYGRGAFAPTADILRVSSVFILALFLNFVLGTAVMAANRQKPWILVKAVAVAVLLALNVLLIPASQERLGNGGIGAATAAAGAEVLLLAAALALLPVGTLDRRVAGDVGRALVAMVAMAGTKQLLRGAPLGVGVPVAVLAFAVALVAVGGVGRSDLRDLLAAIVPSRAKGLESQA